MSVNIRKYKSEDLVQLTELWNEIITAGSYFPQETPLSLEEAAEFFSSQSQTSVAEENKEIVGLYILHPNNIGRCGHIANASYAVKSNQRGKHIGEKLVKASIKAAAELNFSILQFNAVVATNTGAIHLYQKLGFKTLGSIPKGFKLDNGLYEDILLFYIELH